MLNINAYYLVFVLFICILVKINNIMEEIWKDIPEYAGLYQASNLGNVKRFYKNGKVRILKQYKVKNYCLVTLYINSIKKLFYVHRLVWETFNGKIPEGIEVNHIDENPSNNKLENLNLLTHTDNINWGTRNLKASQSLKNNVKLSKTVLQKTRNGEVIREWPSGNEVQRELGFDQRNISRCCIGARPSAYGFVWQYK